MTDKCNELHNIKYQTMLLRGEPMVDSAKGCITNIDAYLDKEKEANRKKAWNKLGKAAKMAKLSAFIQVYGTKHNLTRQEKQELRRYLLVSLERKKLQRVKDVVYDTESGLVMNIPALSYDKDRGRFTLRRLGTIKTHSLKHLSARKRGSK